MYQESCFASCRSIVGLGLRIYRNYRREDNLPPELKQGASVRKGTVLTFSKSGDGAVTVKANDLETPLAVVQSHDLCKVRHI